MQRTVNQVITGIKTEDGAGVRLTRVLSKSTAYAFDPFLMLDVFDSTNPSDYLKGFPWHPHRGIETITYLIHGQMEHKDSLGNKGLITDGGCQWMTAGSGILHQEMPLASKHMQGVQLWLNLPRKDKMVDPKYRDITPQQVIKIHELEADITLLSGYYKNYKAPNHGDYVPMVMMDVTIKPHQTWKLATPINETVFIYIFEKNLWINGQNYEAKQALLFNLGESLEINTRENDVHFLLCQAPALKESIAWGGPIVMNTRQELEKAFHDLDDNTFIKHTRIKT